MGRLAVGLQIDFSGFASLDKMQIAVKDAVTHITNGREISAWVHIAGADTLTGSQARLSFEEKLKLLTEVDVWACMISCRAIGEYMKSRGRGTIITIGWDQAETAWKVIAASSSPRSRPP